MNERVVFDADPTGLSDVRDGLEREVKRRWVGAAREIKRSILQHDVLGIGDKAPQSMMPVADKAALFKRWFDERLMSGVAGYDGSWLEPHLSTASKRGVGRVAVGDAGPDDEPRDDKGRWTEGGGGAAEDVTTVERKPRHRDDFHPDPSKPIGSEARDYVLQHGRETNSEYLVAINSGGQPIDVLAGDKHSVAFTPPMDHAAANIGEQMVVHHNHPSGASLSGADISQLGKVGIAAIWAHGNNGVSYRAALTPQARQKAIDLQGTGQLSLFLAHDIASKTISAAATPKIVEADKTSQDDLIAIADRSHAGWVNEALARAGIIDYRSGRDDVAVATAFGIDDAIDAAAHKARSWFYGRDFGANDRAGRSTQPLRIAGDVGTPFKSAEEPARRHAAQDGADRAGRDAAGFFDALEDEPRDEHGRWTVEREHSAQSTARFPDYQLKVGGVDLGRVRRKLIKAGRIGGSYDVWAIHGSEHPTQGEAESRLIERGKKFGYLKDAQQGIDFLVSRRAPSAGACHAASVGHLATICEDVSQRAHDAVAGALMSRARPMQVARLVDQAMGQGLRRTRQLAEHALTQSYSQATLDALEASGVTHVGTLSEHRRLRDFDPDQPRDDHGKWAPTKSVTAYKLFEKKGDQLYPLFIGSKTPTPQGEWLKANFIPTKGYAERPGWHAGVLPIAPHLRTKAGKIAPSRVWAEVELPADKDYQAMAESSPTRDIRGHVPEGGFYRFKTNKMQGGAWMIGGALKIKRTLGDPEVASLLRKHGVPERDIKGEMHDGAIRDFDPDEPRDEVGRWTAGSSTHAGYEFVSPNVDQHPSLAAAKSAVASPRHAAMLGVSHEIDSALGLKSSDRTIIGAWADGAENSVMTALPDASWDQVRLSAAMKGHVGDQKQVLAFKQNDDGDAVLYNFSAKGSLEDIHQSLLADGVAFHTLAPSEGGAEVYVVDTDGQAHDAVDRASRRANAPVTYQRGQADFLGSTLEAGTDREVRDDARRAYEKVIAESPVPHGAEVWAGNGDRWGQALSAASQGADRSPEGGAGGGAGLRQAQAAAAEVAEGHQPLQGLPQKPVELDGQLYVPGPIGRIRDAAERYMAGKPYAPPTTYVKLDKERAGRIADAFDAMPDAPDDPAVKASYAAMTRETLAQWQEVKASGLKVDWIQPGQADPYASNPRAAAMDVAKNNHWWGYPTDLGYGSGDLASQANNPMLADSGEVIGGRKALVNDVFRVVHDYFGHFKEGNGFRAEGEDNAWRSHASMFSREALPAMTAETRGQNSWVNFGPYGETNRKASAGDTHYAPQKIGILPDWTFDDIPKGRLTDALEDEPRDERGRWTAGGRLATTRTYCRLRLEPRRSPRGRSGSTIRPAQRTPRRSRVRASSSPRPRATKGRRRSTLTSTAFTPSREKAATRRSSSIAPRAYKPAMVEAVREGRPSRSEPDRGGASA